MSRCIPSDVRSAALVTFVLCIYMAFSTPFGAEQPWLQDGTVGNNTTEAGLREELTREREAHARTRAVSPTSPLRAGGDSPSEGLLETSGTSSQPTPPQPAIPLPPTSELSDLPNALRSSPDPKHLARSTHVLKSSFCGGVNLGAWPPPTCSNKKAPGNLGSPAGSALCTDKGRVTAYCAGLDAGLVSKLSQEDNRKGEQLCKQKGYAPCRSYSQQDEDMLLFSEFFSEAVGSSHTYLELGALDGVVYSNTKFLENTMGWSGVLIEASTPSYGRLKTNRNQSNNAMFHLAVCETAGMITFTGTNAEAGIASEMSALHFAKNKHGAKSQIECRRMSDILHDAKVSSIDFWSLDVEGAEIQVLRSMDWSIPVHVLLVERTPNDLEIEKLLLEKGFRYSQELRGNRVWVNDNFRGNTERTLKPGARH